MARHRPSWMNDTNKDPFGDENEAGGAAKEASEFEKMLGESQSKSFDRIAPGKRVNATIVSVGSMSIMLDIGQRSEAVVDRGEFSDEEIAKMVPGMTLELYVSRITPSEIEMSKGVKGNRLDMDAMRTAYQSGLPIEGKVSATNKGGFTVDLPGGKGFVPFSQIELGAKQEAEKYVGQTYRFRVMEIRGRDVILSRASLQRDEQEQERQKLVAEIGEGQNRSAKVVKLEKFGVFVDLGMGLHALVPGGEVSWSRGMPFHEVVTVGQEIPVKIMKVEQLGTKTRISASIKQAEGDPWSLMGERFTVGQTVEGEVTRLAQFGAFVELTPGIEGLIHISEMSAKKRVHQAGEVVQPKDKVTVQIVSVDPISRRIGLSLKALQEGDSMAVSESKDRARRDADEEGRGVEFHAPTGGGASPFAAAFQQAMDRGKEGKNKKR